MGKARLAPRADGNELGCDPRTPSVAAAQFSSATPFCKTLALYPGFPLAPFSRLPMGDSRSRTRREPSNASAAHCETRFSHSERATQLRTRTTICESETKRLRTKEVRTNERRTDNRPTRSTDRGRRTWTAQARVHRLLTY